MMLPHQPDPPRYYRVELPALGIGWLTLNQRGQWFVHRGAIKAWRALACATAIGARVPKLTGAHIIGELRFTVDRRRDPHNWMPTAKAAIDGLVDAGVFLDDNADTVIGPDMRLGPIVKRGKQSLVLHIWPRDPGEWT